jgi:thiamine pyrophosphokinase
MLKKLHLNDFLCPALYAGRALPHTPSSNQLLMLNSNSFSARIAKDIWPACGFKVCADGAANRLHDGMVDSERASYVPDFILGDLDSLRADVSAYYTCLGTQVTLLKDQDENDMDKSVLYIQALLDATPATPQTQPPKTQTEKGLCAAESTLIVLGAYGGRFDQEMAAISSLFRFQGAFSRVLLLSEDSCTSLLQPHILHRIQPIRNASVREGDSCGLIPINGKVGSVTTSGLQWDLAGEALQLGVRISSSNSIPAADGAEEAEVTIQASEALLWTMQCHFTDKDKDKD